MQTSQELYDRFRSDVQDEVRPYLWSDVDVFTYMNAAYVTFVRNTGGVADSTSAITQVSIVAGEQTATVSPLILRYRAVYLLSTGEEISVINEQDPTMPTSDYKNMRRMINDTRPGPVRYMVIGTDRNQDGNLVKWVQVPAVADTAQLSVYRLPLTRIPEGDGAFTFPDIGAEHIEHLALGMKASAYGKHDADVFDATKRDYYKTAFAQYCGVAKAEWERYKHKTRAIAYGGI